MKKYIIPSFLILMFMFFGYMNYIRPVTCMFTQCDNLFYKTVYYYFLITTYILVIVVLVIEKGNLEIFNFDRVSLIALALTGVDPYNLKIPYEGRYKVFCVALSSILLLCCVINWRKIPKTKLNWAMLGILSFIFVIPLAFAESIQIAKYAESNELFAKTPVVFALSNFFFYFKFIGPFEEVVFRGVLWGQLRKWDINENRIFWVQGCLFFFSHGLRLSEPITFFIALPIVTVIFSLLVRYSKQLFPSIVSHTLLDTFISTFVGVVSRK